MQMTQSEWLEHPCQLFKTGAVTLAAYSIPEAMKAVKTEWPISNATRCGPIDPYAVSDHARLCEELDRARKAASATHVGISSQRPGPHRGHYLFVDGLGAIDRTSSVMRGNLENVTNQIRVLTGDPVQCHVYDSGNSFHAYWSGTTVSTEIWTQTMAYLAWYSGCRAPIFDVPWIHFSLMRGFSVLRWDWDSLPINDYTIDDDESLDIGKAVSTSPTKGPKSAIKHVMTIAP